MSDRREYACQHCGSFLHHEDACPKRERIEGYRKIVCDPDTWNPEGIAELNAIFDSALSAPRAAEAGEDLATAKQDDGQHNAPQEQSTAWIATSESGKVLHFSEADGWKVEAVQSVSKEQPVEPSSHD